MVSYCRSTKIRKTSSRPINYTLIAATQSPTKLINGTKSKAAARAGIRLGFALCAAQPLPPLKNLAFRKSSEKFDIKHTQLTQVWGDLSTALHLCTGWTKQLRNKTNGPSVSGSGGWHRWMYELWQCDQRGWQLQCL